MKFFEEYELLAKSELFDAEFYLSTNPDVAAAGVDPILHYLEFGAQESRNPHPLFDSERYLQQCDALGEKPENPLLHFLLVGAFRGLNPIRPPFSASETLDKQSEPPPSPELHNEHVSQTALPQDIAASDNLDSASVKNSRPEVVAILDAGLFDRPFYNSTYGLNFSSDVEAIEDFVLSGSILRRKPNLYFDTLFYIEKYSDIRNASVVPFYHYIVQGFKEGRQPSLYFDPVWYVAHYGIPNEENPLAHYFARRKTCTVGPVPDFDVEFYAATNQDVRDAGVDPFEHFLLYGYREMRNPSERFNLKFYAKRYLGGNDTENPFIHFLQHKHEPGVYGSPPADEQSIPRSVRAHSKPGPHYQEFKPIAPTIRRRAMILAYYLPQFHAFPENDRWWGKGFTEWTNIIRGVPRFEGHYQPRVPRDLGFYSLATNDAVKRQVEFAKGAGVHGFVYYYYWFNGKRLLEKPLDNLLADESIDMPFCLMWANENWTRRWDGADAEILISQEYDPDDDERLIADFARYFKDKRYIRIQGRPLLMIYRPGLIPKTQDSVKRWHELFKTRFGEEPIFIMAQTFEATDPRDFGFDGAIEFPPHKHTQKIPTYQKKINWLDWEFSGKIYSYDDVASFSLDEPTPSFPLIKTIIPSWDNDARRQGAGLVVTESTPEKYEAWLSELVKRAERNPFFGEPIVCVNAWNEWCEAAYLEPDQYFGSAYLNATARAVTGISQPASAIRLLLVGHDAFPSGAQHLLLNIGKTLRRNFGIDVEFLLLAGGEFLPRYKEVAPVTVASTDQELEAFAKAASERGIRHAILNSTGSARALGFLESGGIDSILLVHELPSILHAYHLLDLARVGLERAKQIIFAAKTVRDQVLNEVDLKPDARMRILPQGNYKSLRYSKKDAIAIRKKLKILDGESMVICVGYAELRKGFDHFLQVWRLCNQGGRRIHFCWLGGIHPDFENWISAEIADAKASGTFHMPGPSDNVAGFLSASDVFVLTSREDPFPTVVHEALGIGLPVIAFDKAGGMSDFLRETGMGDIVPYGNTVAMAAAIDTALSQGITQEARTRREEFVKTKLNFGDYVDNLLRLALPELATVSVAIPNYNYGNLIPERLGSIFNQSYPVHEVIVLDDRSTDNSLEMIKSTASDWEREIKLLENQVNSGSVFRQWRKAAEFSSGEFVWIAEADDLSDPHFLMHIMNIMYDDPRISVAFSDSVALNKDGTVMWESYKGYYAETEPGALCNDEVFEGHEFVRRFLGVRNIILNASAVVWRRAALLRALAVCEKELTTLRMAGDWRLYLEVLSEPGSKIAYVAEPLNKHRRHSESVTHTLDAEKHVAEIRHCQAFAAKTFHLTGIERKSQENYAEKIAQQLTPSTAKRNRAAKRKPLPLND